MDAELKLIANKRFKTLSIHSDLNGDTREDRYEINEEFTEDDEQEMRDIDRATLGFCPLGDYESKLEEDYLIRIWL